MFHKIASIMPRSPCQHALRRRFAIMAVALLLASGTPATADTGCLDRSFALEGWSLDPPGHGAAIARQPDGKLVVAGTRDRYVPGPPPLWASDFAVARYTADGVLDPSFGGDGSVETSFGLDDYRARASAAAIALQDDGKIVVAGAVLPFVGPPLYLGPARVALIRYTGDGTLDDTFGTGGFATTAFAADARGVVVLPGGKIVVAGSSPSGPFGAPQFFFARYDADGTLDPTFGTGGRVAFGAGTGRALARQSDGSMVVAGLADPTGIALARVDAGGTPDAGFGAGGIVVTDAGIPAGTRSSAQALVVQPDGKLVAGAFAYGRGFTLVRYGTDGTLDPAFGDAGITAPIPGTTTVFALGLDDQGKLVAAGSGYNGVNYFVALARFTTDGTLDPSLGDTGVITTEFDASNDDIAAGVVPEPDGSIVIAGAVGTSNFLLARYHGTECSIGCQPPQCAAPLACAAFAGKNRLLLQHKPLDDRLTWRWTHAAEAVDLADFGAPDPAGSDFDLQILDAAYGGRVVDHWPDFFTGSCSASGCWKAGAQSLRFTSSSSGVKGKLRAGPVGKGSIEVSWKSDIRFLPLTPLVPPVTIRFLRTGGRECWVATFTGAAVRKNDAATFDAR